MTTHVLLIDDDDLQRTMLAKLLMNKFGYAVAEAASGAAGLKHLTEGQTTIDLIILDYMMPDLDGLQTLQQIRTTYPALPVIMLTASTDVAVAIQAIKLGAQDYVLKPVDPVHFGVTVQNALKLQTLSQEVIRLKRQQDQVLHFSDLIGHDSGLAEAVALGRRIAASDISVLITGETGVGKELYARALHGESNRAGRPFVAVNCGSIPVNLVESILFGHEKGAFTGAVGKTIGKFREADGGTILLDEIGDLPLDTQVKLLRVLQQRDIEPVGSSKTVPVNVRVIAATNRNLQDDVKAKRFREDLYFRLCGMPVHIPALRERKQDVAPLANALLQRCLIEDHLPAKRISPQAHAWLQDHAWPGNVRELENLIRRSSIMDNDGVLDVDDLLAATRPTQSLTPAGPSVAQLSIELLDATGQMKSIAALEHEIMALALRHYEANVSQAARALGIAKSTFYRKFYHDTLSPLTPSGETHVHAPPL